MLTATRDIPFGKGQGRIAEGATFEDAAAVIQETRRQTGAALPGSMITGLIASGAFSSVNPAQEAARAAKAARAAAAAKKAAEEEARKTAALGNPEE